MKAFWKILGLGALAVGLTPYRVEKDEETGEKKYQALLWQATKTPKEGEKDALNINIGLNLPQEDADEAHLFSDELCVEYNGTPVTEPAAPEAPAEPEEPAAPVEEEAPVEETPAEPEEPAETPENREEA